LVVEGAWREMGEVRNGWHEEMEEGALVTRHGGVE